MVRKTAFLALFLLVGTVFFYSCDKEELSGKKEILALIFEASKNEQLDRNFLGEIEGTSITAEVAFGVDITQLVPTIEISPRATVSPTSGLVTDFTGPVVYTVTAEDGTTKTFTTSVTTAPAPYLGEWHGGPIDFGAGLMNIDVEITESGEITLALVKIMTGEKDGMSMKGYFDPNSRQDIEIKLEQTHRWFNTDWISESKSRSLMYHMSTPQNMKLYYCLDYPVSDWCFQINLSKL
jgi:hypothetical protein